MRANTKNWGLRTNWQFVRHCLGFLFSNKRLLTIPFLSFLVTSLALGLGAATLLASSGFLADNTAHSIQLPAGYLSAEFLLLFFLLNFISLFFNSALLACIINRLRNQPCSIKQGLGIAWNKIGNILVWSLVSGSLGLLLNTLERSSGLIRRLVLLLLGCSWSVISYFVLPLIIMDNLTPASALKQSYRSFKGNWRKMFSVFGMLFLTLVPIFIALFAFTFFMQQLALPVLILIVLLTLILLAFPLILISSILNTVVKAALYLESIKHSTPMGMDKELLDRMLVQK